MGWDWVVGHVDQMGIEPTASAMRMRRSTDELLALITIFNSQFLIFKLIAIIIPDESDKNQPD